MKNLEIYNVGSINSPGFDQRLLEQLLTEGLVFFDGVHDSGQLLELAHSLGQVRPHKEADGNGISRLVSDLNKPMTADYVDTELNPHTDGTRVRNSAHLLTLYCEQPAKEGGVSQFLSGEDLYRYLEYYSPRLLEDLHKPWRFGTPEDGFTAPIFEARASNTTVRFRRDHFDTFPESIRQELDEALKTLAVAGLTKQIKLSAGQGVVVDNLGVLHGRSLVNGNRVVVRANVDMSPEHSSQLGFTI